GAPPQAALPRRPGGRVAIWTFVRFDRRLRNSLGLRSPRWDTACIQKDTSPRGRVLGSRPAPARGACPHSPPPTPAVPSSPTPDGARLAWLLLQYWAAPSDTLKNLQTASCHHQ